MQYAYIFGVLTYQTAFSDIGEEKFSVSSMQKVAVIMLAYTTGKYFFIYPFSRFQKATSKSMAFYITGGVCLLNLIAQFLIVSLSLKSYNAGWFFAAFVFGLQDATLSCKQETNIINVTTEIEDANLDSCILGKLIGATLIFFLGGVFKVYKPQVLLIILTITLALSCGVSFLCIKREADPTKSKSLPKEELIEEQKLVDEKLNALPEELCKVYNNL